ncbi:peptidoglycan recognition protein [Streptomyces sp. NPDC091266]|uniref:peptidoglycan recognition protein family protein n=1 Tax=Streptomyces sp. NPDC091266 TaxID=3365978 RepID=UPI0037FC74B0
MRPFLALLAITLGAAGTAALTLPPDAPAGAAATRPAHHLAPPAEPPRATPGSTQSLPVADAGHTAAVPGADRAAPPAPGVRGVPAHAVRPFSLVGVVWDDAATELHGRVQVRTRATGTGNWSIWQDVQAHNDDQPDLDSPERQGRVRGSSAPLWVGDSDAVAMRVIPQADDRAPATLPGGLRLELVDPGAAPQAERGVQHDLPATQARRTPAGPFTGPRPRIVTRAGWGADETIRQPGYGYTGTVRAAFVHHSATGNNYTCAQAPSVIRAMYRYHVKSSGWRDIGYNFLVDKCGTVYEGRAGGVDKPVMGAHTLGFNTDSTGIAVLGTFTGTEPPEAALDAVAGLTAWKLGLNGINPAATTQLRSGGGNRFKKGATVQLNVISGHRDGFRTECPGARLYAKLGAARTAAARLQGR